MSPAQQEQLMNVGAYLQSIREEQGKTVDEVANQIFIRSALVRAIEAGNWEVLPEPVFVQGFIRRYADYLGLDGREISQQLQPALESVLPDPNVASKDGVEGLVDKPDKHSPKVLSKTDAQPSNRAVTPSRAIVPWGWVVGAGAIAVLAGGGFWLVAQRLPRTVATPPPVENETVSSDTSETPETSETSTTSETEVLLPTEAALETEAGAEMEPLDVTANETNDSPPITFEVNLEGDSWMRVIVDGEEVYEGILTTGTQQAWTAQSELRVTAGNSGAVLYSFNGGTESPLGAPGAVSNLTLTPSTTPQVPPTQ